jgi:hypothetical protein
VFTIELLNLRGRIKVSAIETDKLLKIYTKHQLKSLPSKSSQEHLKAQALKITQGLYISYTLQRAYFFLAKSGGSFLLKTSQALGA